MNGGVKSDALPCSEALGSGGPLSRFQAAPRGADASGSRTRMREVRVDDRFDPVRVLCA